MLDIERKALAFRDESSKGWSRFQLVRKAVQAHAQCEVFPVPRGESTYVPMEKRDVGTAVLSESSLGGTYSFEHKRQIFFLGSLGPISAKKASKKTPTGDV